MHVLLADVVRYYVVIAALWVSALLAWILYRRWQDSGFRTLWGRGHAPHSLVVVGMIVLMLSAVLRRFEQLGQPINGILLLVTVGVSAILAGLLINLRFTFTPPWKRQ